MPYMRPAVLVSKFIEILEPQGSISYNDIQYKILLIDSVRENYMKPNMYNLAELSFPSLLQPQLVLIFARDARLS